MTCNEECWYDCLFLGVVKGGFVCFGCCDFFLTSVFGSCLEIESAKCGLPVSEPSECTDS